MPKHNIMWSKVDVRKRLESHRNYYLLFDEYEGKFACEYIVSGVKILVFNCVGGIPEIWFGYSFDPDADLASAQEFVRIAYSLLREHANCYRNR